MNQLLQKMQLLLPAKPKLNNSDPRRSLNDAQLSGVF